MQEMFGNSPPSLELGQSDNARAHLVSPLTFCVMYVKTFCNGIDEVPVIKPEIREKINTDFEWEGLEWLQKEVEKTDPLYFSKGETKNPHRLMRALEVKLSTGRSIIEFQTQQKEERDFNILKIVPFPKVTVVSINDFYTQIF